ncbi:hypothetical protein [Xenorhabdus sp. TS4]|uniref:hypothetical protein n=1 Tax=Xenorhabdus sp. TS4 TaxID=1873483 RepID=UPI0016571745|nr:hypothetical protein [Xenorhabdus sp. TS4]MBC8949901.1 hypothetical protein [Xenorhabdus sp. TS4]
MMKNKQLKKLRQEFDTLGLIEKDPDVVGYVLLNTRNSRFATMDENEFGMAIYADDIEAAYLAPSRLDALMNIDFLPETDQTDIAVIPVIENPLFGLVLKKQDEF